VKVIDPIDLEVLRSRLEAIAEQAASAVEHTAISPTITESKDYSVTLLDADGGLILGAGQVLFHFGAASHAVRSTIERHDDTIGDGDVFLGNDPHNGGGLHPQDVMVQRPIYYEGDRIAWVVISAHLLDVGGMVVGSFAPDATECFQEGLRFPPVRLFRRDVEVTDVWDLFRNNVRMADIVEMDLRGLVAGCHFAQDRFGAVIDAVGEATFVESLRAIRDLSEAEMRRRVGQIEDGVYRATSWTEFDETFYEIPCTLTVDGDHMVFDFEGASPQTSHFFNSKPYIIESEFVVMLAQRMAPDLPFNEGIFAPIELRCPVGSIVNSTPPAPISAAHMHVGLNAAGVAMQAVNLALAASPDAPARRYLGGAGFESALGNQIWSWTDADGVTDAFVVLDGNWVGGSAGAERDGGDLGRNPVGVDVRGAYPDIEILESWFPLLFTERRTRSGVEGAGEYRSGGGNQLSFRPHGVDEISGTMFGMRRWLPLQGFAGGDPGACNEFVVHHGGAAPETLAVNSSGNTVRAGESVEMRIASGGGYGDRLERDAELVARDVSEGRFEAAEAAAVYGVVLDAGGAVDLAATHARRTGIRAARLRDAAPPVHPVTAADAEAAAAANVQGRPQTPNIGASGRPCGSGSAAGQVEAPLYPGVVQRGAVAYAAASGAPLAIAPAHWTDGCPVLVERRWDAAGPDVVFRTYLDPRSGRALHVEAAVGNSPRSFEVSPTRWTQA
jgi:N-methylhydantoinase B